MSAACGGDDAAREEQVANPNGSPPTTQDGGRATFAYVSFPDFLDPALSYTVAGWQAMNPVYTPLLTYRRVEGAPGSELIPGLAEALPEVSRNGRTYRLRLRAGLRYSDGSRVAASDFEHTIKRVLRLQSGGSSFFEGIEGAPQYLQKRRAGGDIRGIDTDDRTGEITVRLTAPDGRFPYILAMNFAGLVPGGTAFKNLTDQPPPGVGPFQIGAVRPGRSFLLRKNAFFPRIPGVPAALLDEIRVEVRSGERSIRDVLENKVDYIYDPPVGDALREFREQAGDRYEEHVMNSTYYFFMNHDTAPFDDLRVRQAVNLAIDKRALARLYGGLLQPTCNFLPPGMRGYREVDPCPWGDPEEAPDVARARELVDEAGARGAEVVVWGNTEKDYRDAALYLSDVLNEIGLKARPSIVDGSVYYTTVGNQETKAPIGVMNWVQDFPHPSNFLFLMHGDTIQPTNNVNFSRVDDDRIDRTLDRLDQNPRLEEVAEGYAEIDRRIIEQAHIATYGHRKIPVVTSERIDPDRLIWHPVLQADFTSFSLRR